MRGHNLDCWSLASPLVGLSLPAAPGRAAARTPPTTLDRRRSRPGASGGDSGSSLHDLGRLNNHARWNVKTECPGSREVDVGARLLGLHDGQVARTCAP